MNNSLWSTLLVTPTLVGLNYLLTPSSARGDVFSCYQPDNCLLSAIVASEPCVKTQDNPIVSEDNLTIDVVVLSVYDSRIESRTGHISDTLAELYNWNRYDFSGHGSMARTHSMAGAYSICG